MNREKVDNRSVGKMKAAILCWNPINLAIDEIVRMGWKADNSQSWDQNDFKSYIVSYLLFYIVSSELIYIINSKIWFGKHQKSNSFEWVIFATPYLNHFVENIWIDFMNFIVNLILRSLIDLAGLLNLAKKKNKN